MQISEVAGSLFRAAAAIMVFVLTVVQKKAAQPGKQKLLALEIMSIKSCLHSTGSVGIDLEPGEQGPAKVSHEGLAGGKNI